MSYMIIAFLSYIFANLNPYTDVKDISLNQQQTNGWPKTWGGNNVLFTLSTIAIDKYMPKDCIPYLYFSHRWMSKTSLVC